MRRSTNRREGYALAVAIFAIVVIGALVAGAFFAANQEYRIGRNGLQQARALTASEYGHGQMLAIWNTDWNTQMKNGDTLLRVTRWADGSLDTVRITKLNDLSFHLVSEGWSGGTSIQAAARRRTAVLLRINIPEINIRGALTTRGQTKIGGSSQINGNDTSYTGWDCPPAGAAKPGIAIDDSTKITTSGCGGYSCVSGSPKIAQDPAAGDTNTYFGYGGLDWQQLAAMSNTQATGSKSVAPTYANGQCNKADPNNWGDPNRNAITPGLCEGYFPIIYSSGNLHMTGGQGQGILLVDGDLTVSGGFQFFGPVIVRGNLKTTGTGGHFNGGVMAANVDLEQNTVLGNAVVRFSSCALVKALSGSSLPDIAAGRAWTDLY